MIKLWLVVLVVGFAALAEAQTYRIIIEGSGPPPKITQETQGTVPPPVVPPVVPPATEAFVWPPQPSWMPSDHTARYFFLGIDPKGAASYDSTWYYYRALSEYPSPNTASLFACFLASGDRVWAPRNGTPASIRRVCAGGRP